MDSDDAFSAMEAAVIEQLSAGGPPKSSPPEQETEEALPESKYGFDEDFQRRIAALTIRDAAFVRRTEGLIKPDYFENASIGLLVSLALDYYEKYRAVPRAAAVWRHLFRDAINSRRIHKEMGPEVATTLKTLFKESLSDSGYIIDQVASFARTKAIERAMVRSFDLMEKGRIDEAQELMEKAFRVGAAEEFQAYDYWNDIERRTQYRKDILSGLIKPDGIPTGIKEIDRILYHKGWGRKELSVIMGGAKKGKSMGLGEFVVRASMLGFNALYLTLEVSSEIIMDRMDANVSSVAMDELTDNVVMVESQVTAKKASTLGSLRICQFPSGTLRPKDLRRILERFRSDGVIFDLIVVDYADIMSPDRPMSNEREESKQIWLGLRAIAFEESAAVLTATQTNRDGFTASTAKAEHAAEDFNKVRIADLIISINRTEVEAAAGEARLYFAASRNQAGEFALRITQDLSKMKFIKKVLGPA